ncbi:MAG: nucleoside deaminase [Bryobacterales bacterium]|nr:nucleoside deaminase [Bryobacterales bacterium]
MKADYLRRAIELAVENVRSGRGGPFGAVIIADGAIVAEGVNQVTSTNDPTAHAEVVAIRAACRKLGRFDLRGCQIYASCEPCPMCLAAIYWARIDQLYFGATHKDAAAAGFDDSYIYKQVPLSPRERALPTERMLEEEAQSPFEEWRRSTTKIPY